MAAKTSDFPAAPWGSLALTGWRRAWLRFLHALPRGSMWRRIALWLRKPLKGGLGAWVDVEVWGLRLRLRGRGNLSEQRLILMPQYLDTAEREALTRELAGGGIFLDIGANAGVYSLWVAKSCGPSVTVHAFEPDPELCESLRCNLALNQLDHVRLHMQALGRSEGAVSLVAGSGNKGENRIAAATTAGSATTMTTLPAFLEREAITHVAAMKIDIEGHETDALEPLFTATPRSAWPRLLICEVVHDADDRLTALLAKNGYQLVARGRLNGIYRLTP